MDRYILAKYAAYTMAFLPLFLAAGIAPTFAQPTVTALQNNYSYTQPGLPNYGISPGSLFIIKGTGLANTTNTTEAFPLTQNLNGTSFR